MLFLCNDPTHLEATPQPVVISGHHRSQSPADSWRWLSPQTCGANALGYHGPRGPHVPHQVIGVPLPGTTPFRSFLPEESSLSHIPKCSSSSANSLPTGITMPTRFLSSFQLKIIFCLFIISHFIILI